MSKVVIPLGFQYVGTIIHPDGRREEGPPVCNLIPQDGIDHFVGLLRGTTSPISNWYLGVFEGNYVPTAGVKAADLQTTVQECQAYSEATRPAWTHDYDGISVVDNAAAKVIYTFPVGKTLHGGFLISSAGKGGNTGIVLSIARFDSPRVIPAGGKFELGAGLILVPTNVL